MSESEGNVTEPTPASEEPQKEEAQGEAPAETEGGAGEEQAEGEKPAEETKEEDKKVSYFNDSLSLKICHKM